MKVQMNEKSKEKDIKVQRVKPLTQTQANEQQMRGKRKDKTKQRVDLQPNYPEPFSCLL